MGLKRTKDRWAFLDNIEAPMWVDLTLEDAKFNGHDIDDDWFLKSHPFHQCSSRQLKAALSCSGEESVDSNFELLGSSSPKLPSSVSRSRGKDYRSKKGRGENFDVRLNKAHPHKVLSEKSTFYDVGTIKKTKSKSNFIKPKSAGVDLISSKDTKPKLSFINSKGTSSSKSSLVSDKSSAENAKQKSSKTLSSSRDLDNSSSSMVDKADESNACNTVTSDSSLQGQQNTVEVSSRVFGHSSGLLSAVRISLRKSCVARQALRVETNKDMGQSTIEINRDRRQSRVESNDDRRESEVGTSNDMRQSTMGINSNAMQSRVEIDRDRRESRDHKSSSSKSSMGSSSALGFDVKSSTFISTRKKEKTPDSRNVVRMTEAPRDRPKVSNASKVSKIQDNKGTFYSRREDITTFKKSTYQETTKSKEQSHILSINSSVPLRVNGQKSCPAPTKAGEKVRSNRLNKQLNGGKENVMGKMSYNHKCSGRENASEGVVKGQSRKQQNVPQRRVTRALASQKGKIGNQSEVKNSLSVNQRVYLR